MLYVLACCLAFVGSYWLRVEGFWLVFAHGSCFVWASCGSAFAFPLLSPLLLCFLPSLSVIMHMRCDSSMNPVPSQHRRFLDYLSGFAQRLGAAAHVATLAYMYSTSIVLGMG
jgi:hypothetical protein